MESKKTYTKPEIRFFPAGSPQFTAIMAVLKNPADHNSCPPNQITQKQEEPNVQASHHRTI